MPRLRGNDQGRAYSADYPSSGRATFILDGGMRIWKKDTGGEPVERWPRNPASQGGQPLD